MDLTPFKKMESHNLISHIEFLLWHYRVISAFRFLYVPHKFDQSVAERINKRVWRQVPVMGARDLGRQFQIVEKWHKDFVEALKLFPRTVIVGHQIEERDDEFVCKWRFTI